ncbi:MAG: ribokinase [Clostridia bacterium]|nr:ribokinase [Clostridia bacterium]
MKVLVFGSLNLDRTYSVDHLARPGETISAASLAEFCGGKGFNQAISLRRAGLEVAFAGAVGPDGGALTEALEANGIDRRLVQTLPGSTGHAIIQVDKEGANNIIILAGTNGMITRERIAEALEGFGPGDLLAAQNEISNVPFLLEEAARRGMKTAFNPSPYNSAVQACDLHNVTWLLINETEGAGLTGETDEGRVLASLHGAYPRLKVVLTLGERGSLYLNADGTVTRCGIYPTQAVDTTAAGDTFTGYFLEAITRGVPAADALRQASAAAAISVSRKGAEPSIPWREEVDRFMAEEAPR